MLVLVVVFFAAEGVPFVRNRVMKEAITVQLQYPTRAKTCVTVYPGGKFRIVDTGGFLEPPCTDGYRTAHHSAAFMPPDKADTLPLVAAAKGADVHIHVATIMKDIISDHTTPEQAGKSAHEAGVELLVINHWIPRAHGADHGIPWHSNCQMLSTDEKRSPPATDGRVRRSERSRAAIVQALFELLIEGVMAPTADEVADRVSIGIRTVFRQFKDMDALYGALDALLYERFEPIFLAPVPEGSIDERIDEFVARRTRSYEDVAPCKRAANIKRAHSELLQERH